MDPDEPEEAPVSGPASENGKGQAKQPERSKSPVQPPVTEANAVMAAAGDGEEKEAKPEEEEEGGVAADLVAADLADGTMPQPGSADAEAGGGDAGNTGAGQTTEGNVQAVLAGASETSNALMHTGTYVEPIYNPRTLEDKDRSGYWTCCYEREKYSLYCESLEARERMAERLERWSQLDGVRAQQKASAEERRAQWEQHKIDTEDDPIYDVVQTGVDSATLSVDRSERSENAVMLLTHLNKNNDDSVVVQVGLGHIETFSETLEGALMFLRHEGIRILLAVQAKHVSNDDFQQSIIRTLRKLLDREELHEELFKDDRVVHTVFAILSDRIKDEHSVSESLTSVKVCSTNELCRTYMYDHNLMPYIMNIMSFYRRNADFLVLGLEILTQCSNTDERLQFLLDNRLIMLIVKCMQKHKRHTLVLQRAMELLLVSANRNELAYQQILEQGAIPAVVNALKALVNQERLQFRGLQMLEEMSRTEAGWKQIADMRGALQWLAQGTFEGNKLLHLLPGYFHNPGWCIADTHHLPPIERQLLEAKNSHLQGATKAKKEKKPKGPRAASEGTERVRGSVAPTRRVTRAELAARAKEETESLASTDSFVSGTGAGSRELSKHALANNWTPMMLKDFMGLSTRRSHLKSTLEDDRVHFELLKRLALLPVQGEDRAAFFQRIRDYERENRVRISDILEVQRELARREFRRKRAAEKAEEKLKKRAVAEGPRQVREGYADDDEGEEDAFTAIRGSADGLLQELLRELDRQLHLPHLDRIQR